MIERRHALRDLNKSKLIKGNNTSSGNAETELEDYSRKITPEPGFVRAIHRDDGGLTGQLARLDQDDVVVAAGNAHI